MGFSSSEPPVPVGDSGDEGILKQAIELANQENFSSL